MVAKLLKHKFTSGIADGADATVVRPSNWNDDHNLWMGKRTVGGTTDTMLDADHMCLVRYACSAPCAVTIPQAGAGGLFASGWMTFIRNVGPAAVTFTPTTSTVNEGATLQLQKDEYGILFSDGTNYDMIRSFAPSSAAFPGLRFDTASQGLSNTQQDNAFTNLGAALQRSATFTALRYDTSQTLTESQKNQVQTNAGLQGVSSIRNLFGGVTSGTTVQFNCQWIELMDGSGAQNFTKRFYNLAASGYLTNNIATAGVTPNGRDQAGAFANGSWVHFYFIWTPSGSTLATLSSLNGPPPGGTFPNMPAGYTHFAYIGCIKMTGAALNVVYFRGPKFYYLGGGSSVLNNGGATVNTFVDCTAYVPSFGQVLDYTVAFVAYCVTAAANIIAAATIQAASGNNFGNVYVGSGGGGTTAPGAMSLMLEMPVIVSQNGFYYSWTNPGFYLLASIASYTVPNGAT